MGEVWKDKPFLFQFLFHFPFYSEKDINKLMDYSYYHIWEFEEDFYDSDVYNAVFNNYWSVYNLYWKHPYNSLAPRMISSGPLSLPKVSITILLLSFIVNTSIPNYLF